MNRRSQKMRCWGMAALVAVACAGCGDNPLGRQAISGTVTFGGAPLDRGTIDFRPAAGGPSVASGATISEGVYEVATDRGLPPGRYEVRIFSSVPDNSPPPEGLAPAGSPPARRRIPPQFNVRTTQVIEVVDGGENEFNFDIPSP